MPNKKNYSQYVVFKMIVKNYKIKGFRDWRERYKQINEETGLVLPCHPEIAYKEFEGWKVLLQDPVYIKWKDENRHKDSFKEDIDRICHAVRTKFTTYSQAIEFLHEGVCEISGNKVVRKGSGKGFTNMHLDHDEDFKYFRGVLCSALNLLIGDLHDNPFLALSVTIYLFKHLNKRIGMKYETNNKMDIRLPNILRKGYDVKNQN
jgi:hypothetical protein